jgi:hypothetical protein
MYCTIVTKNFTVTHFTSLDFKRKSLHINHVSSLHITSLIHLHSGSSSLLGLLDSEDGYTTTLPDVGNFTNRHGLKYPQTPAYSHTAVFTDFIYAFPDV